MISQERAEELANKILQNKISSEEVQEWQEWYGGNLEDPIEVPESFAKSKAIHAARMMNVINGAIVMKRSVRLWPRIAVAAAAVATIVVGVWFLFAPRHPDAGHDPGSAQYANDIAPGKNTATLTLATGKVIDLDTSRTSVVIADSVKAMTMLTAATPRGGTYQVVLPDGTRVWLNADSKISFPSQFNGKERKILLDGEAYFEVAKDTAHPFIVSTENQDVTVLGTHFNINSYKEEGSAKTTLLEGSVRVSSSLPDVNMKNEVVLKPGQQSVLEAGKIAIENVDTEVAIAWKNNEFSFNGDDLQAVMRQIARWYDVEVVYEGNVASSGFVSTISRNKKLSEILRALELNQGVHFKIEGRRIRVTQ